MTRTPRAPVVAPSKAVSRRGVRFWEELFVYMWSVALVANWFEIALQGLIGIVRGEPGWWMPLAARGFFTFQEPYALGTAAVLLIVVPLRDRLRLGNGGVFLVSAVVLGAIEAISGAALVLALGRNTFWDYSWMPFSLDGYTSLAAMIVFGLLAVGFLAVVYPATLPALRRVGDRRLHVLAGVLVGLYLASLLVKLVASGWL